MSDDEILSSDEEHDEQCLRMDKVQKLYMGPDDWEKTLLKVQTEKIGDDRDLFVSMFTRALICGNLPDSAMQHLMLGMLMNPEETAIILGVTFKKGEENKTHIDKVSFQVAMKIVIANKGDLSNVPYEVFDDVAYLVEKDLETVKKYYSKELPTLKILYSIYSKSNSDVISEQSENNIGFSEFIGSWLKNK